MCDVITGPSSNYVISLKAFNNQGEGRPSLENVITREAPSMYDVGSADR